MGKTLVIIGITVALLGCFLMMGEKFLPLGRLPGDIRIEKENFSFYFPVTTCLLGSAVVSFLFWVFSRFK